MPNLSKPAILLFPPSHHTHTPTPPTLTRPPRYSPADVHNDMDGVAFPFALQSENLMAKLGLECEVVKQGSLLFKFNEEGLVEHMEISFDTIR